MFKNQSGRGKSTKLHSPKRIQGFRALYQGAKRHFENLCDQADELMDIITNGRISIPDPIGNNKNTFRYLTSAQIADYKRKLAIVNNDLLLVKNDLGQKEYNFKSLVKKNTRALRNLRDDIKEGLEEKKQRSIMKLLNSNVAGISTDLIAIKDTFPTLDNVDGKQLKAVLLTLIRKVNNGMRITNLSKNTITKLHEGISQWNDTKTKIWEL
jgi:hypothetical protein